MGCHNYYVWTMHTDYRTNIVVNHGFEVNSAHPITTYTRHLTIGKCATPHKHPRAQVISCDRGVMEVHTRDTIWIVNPMQSVWVASMEEHQVFFPDHVTIISAFIDPSRASGLPNESFAFDVSDFIKSLLLKISSYGNPNACTPVQKRVMEVLLDELSNLQPSRTFLPMTQEGRVKKVIDDLMGNLSSSHSLSYYAELSCVSPRTLSRLFVKELGMSFRDWTQRLKLLEAVKRLDKNHSVKEIAWELGYENVSSFIAMFKKHMGKTPTNYR